MDLRDILKAYENYHLAGGPPGTLGFPIDDEHWSFIGTSNEVVATADFQHGSITDSNGVITIVNP